MSLVRRMLRKLYPSAGDRASARGRHSDRRLPQLSDQQVSELKDLLSSKSHWYHSWQVSEEVTLPGHVSVYESLDTFGFPEHLEGAKILDVGTCNGGFAFEFERRGALVTAVDICGPDHYSFESLAKILKSRVRYIQTPVYDLDIHFSADEFDYVFFSGVIYHLRHPLLALDKLHRIAERGIWLESHVIDNHFIVDGKPRKLPAELRNANVMQFYRRDELGNDPSNFFGPSIACLESMLWSCGFRPTLKHASGTRAHFYAEKIAGPPEYERMLMSEHPAYHYTEGTK